MADDAPQIMETDHEKKFLLDPYLDWLAAEGPPVHEGFGLDLLALETGPWPRFDAKGAAGKSDADVKKGGRQIEYSDQDPRLHQQWLDAIAETGVGSDMGEFIDETPFRK